MLVIGVSLAHHSSRLDTTAILKKIRSPERQPLIFEKNQNNRCTESQDGLLKLLQSIRVGAHPWVRYSLRDQVLVVLVKGGEFTLRHLRSIFPSLLIECPDI